MAKISTPNIERYYVMDLFGGVKGVKVERKTKRRQPDFAQAIGNAIDLTDKSIQLWKATQENKSLDFVVRVPLFKEMNDKSYIVNCKIGTRNIQSRKDVVKGDVEEALSGLHAFLTAINTSKPNLSDVNIKDMYDSVKEQRRPKKRKGAELRLLPIEDGGESYWSDTSHTWIKGRKNIKGEWLSPEQYL